MNGPKSVQFFNRRTMRDIEDHQSLPQELQLLRYLFLKDFRSLRILTISVLEDELYSDRVITQAVRAETITEDEALDRILRASLNRAFSYFLEYPKNGHRIYMDRARQILDEGVDLTQNARLVYWWWLFYCTRFLLDEFDTNSLWTLLNPYLDDDGSGQFVDPYIRISYRGKPPVVEFWRSQALALPRITEPERRGYCLKMPTSAGKTRVAELGILRFLLDYRDDPQTKCIYIAPFRSLAVEIEKNLQRSFHPLGIRVSELYGGFELSPVERLLLERTRIIIATPEKIDAFLRYNPEFTQQVRLIIVDEGHIINSTERGIRFEVFLHRIINRFRADRVRFLFISAVLPNTDEFASWITGDPNNVIQSDWRPSRLMLGELRWNGRFAGIHYTHLGDQPLEHECYVSSFIQPLVGKQLKGTRRRNSFPHDLSEVVADAALRFAQQDMTLVFLPQKRSVEPFGETLLRGLHIKGIVAKREKGEFTLPVSEDGHALLDECIAIAKETMGSDARVIKFLQAGFAVHHSQLPQKLRVKIEQLVRQQGVNLIVATTTLAQGVNFPIRTVLVHGLLHDYGQPVSPLDFWNVCGRAGRGMRENEGQVLFSVHLADIDPTLEIDRTLNKEQRDKRREERDKAIWGQSHSAELRQEIIAGYRSYRVISGLRQLLAALVTSWKENHPGVDIAEFCQYLAENNLSWLQTETQIEDAHRMLGFESISGLLDFLDAQLIALTEEQSIDSISPDGLHVILHNSLLMLQLAAEPDELLSTDIADALLYSRLQSIHRRFPLRSQRQRFYYLGFPLSDCERVENKKNSLAQVFSAAQYYYQWDVSTRCDFLVQMLELLFDTVHTLRPDIASIAKIWRDLWKPTLSLWLQGYTPEEMTKFPEVVAVTDSPAEVSILIDHLFSYKAPWGLNALSVFLEKVAIETEQELPTVSGYFSSLVKYGVHSPAASCFLAFGLESRKLALKLSMHCPDEQVDASQLLVWFVTLSEDQLHTLNYSPDEIRVILETQLEARRLTQTPSRSRYSEHITVTVDNENNARLASGDHLVLHARPDIDPQQFSLFTLWGDELGQFQFTNKFPKIWFYCDQIEVSVSKIERQHSGTALTLLIEEV